jgi:predicted phage terminase large subunit-like protein
VVLRRGTCTPRIHPATHNGKPDGVAVFLEPDALAKKRIDQGSYTFGCQMLQDPKADSTFGFKEDDYRYWTPKNWGDMNRYIVVDGASSKKKGSDYTVMEVWGLGRDGNYYLIDGVRDRLKLTERAKWLFKLHRQYRPLSVGNESYGAMADIEHMEEKMERENYRFEIIPLGGAMSKNDRIGMLIPKSEDHRVWMPTRCLYPDYEGQVQNFTRHMEEEFRDFPVSEHDDILDCAARILDPNFGACFPEPEEDFPRNNNKNKARSNYELFD